MKKYIIMVLATVLMSSCGVLKNYKSPQVNATDLYGDERSGDSLGTGDLKWREVFTDPQLQSLIEKTLEKNVNMVNAELQIKELQYAMKAAKTAFIPTITLSPQGAISKLYDPYDRNTYNSSKTYGVAMTFGWQNYNFLNLINQKKGAKVSLEKMKNAKQAIQASLVANVAKLYYTLSQLDQNLELIKQTQANWKQLLDMQKLLMDAGQSNAAAVASYEATYYTISQSIITIENNIRIIENAMSALVQETPGSAGTRGFHNAAALNKFQAPSIVATGAPIRMLNRRPDVRAAELNLASAYYALAEAKSNFYPSVTLSATGSFTNNAGAAIINPGLFITNFVAGLVQPIYQSGRILTAYRIKKEEYQIASNNFTQSLIEAGTEVNTAMYQVRSAEEMKGLIDKQVAALQAAYDANMKLYSNSNNANYLNVITAQNNLLSGQTSQIANRMDAINATIDLYQALGGGVE